VFGVSVGSRKTIRSERLTEWKGQISVGSSAGNHKNAESF
jgi:hypothetical protein